MTTAPAVDVRDHLAAVKTAIDGQFGEWRAYSYGEAPGDPHNPVESERIKPLPYIFALVAVERRYQPARRVTAQAGRSAWRLSVHSVGRTVAETEWARRRITLALDEVSLSVGDDDVTTTLLQHESSTAPVWDDGRFSALSLFTYTA